MTGPHHHLLYQLPEGLAPYVRACYDIACAAHEGQTRKKAGGVVPDYITHPVAALNILRYSSEEDSAILGAALLHDVLEDCQPYLERYAKEKELDVRPPYADVLRALLAHAVQRAGSDADIDKTVALVEELSELGDYPKETKRTRRALSALDYSDEAAKIKIAELAASSADDIIAAPKRSAQEQLRYSDYVWSVAKSAAHIADSGDDRQRDEQTKQLFNLVRYLHDEHRQLYDHEYERQLTDEQKADLRERFSLDEAWEKAQQYAGLASAQPVSMSVVHHNAQAICCGLTEVGLNDAQMVSRCHLMLKNGDEQYRKCDTVISELIRLLEKDDPDNMVSYGRPLPDQPFAVQLKFLKPIMQDQFLQLAQKAHAVTDRYFYNALQVEASEVPSGMELLEKPDADKMPRQGWQGRVDGRKSGWIRG